MCKLRSLAMSALANKASIEVQARRLLTLAHKSKYTAKNIITVDNNSLFDFTNTYDEDDIFDVIVFKYAH